MDTPCDICGDPTHDYRSCTKEAYRESQDVGQSPVVEEIPGAPVQIVTFLIQAYVLVHGVTNQDI